jgi:hypothetical protein
MSTYDIAIVFAPFAIIWATWFVGAIIVHVLDVKGVE